MKSWNSAFNAQGLRLIIVGVRAGAAVKIYRAALEALRKKERPDETQFTIKISGETSPGSQLLRFFIKFSFLVTRLITC
jgi:hypothetical protein